MKWDHGLVMSYKMTSYHSKLLTFKIFNNFVVQSDESQDDQSSRLNITKSILDINNWRKCWQ